MVIVTKSVIQIYSGVFLSALGLHNYNRLLAHHLQKNYWLFFMHSFSSQNAPKIQSQRSYLQNFLGGASPRPPSISMLIVVHCTINLTSTSPYTKGPTYILSLRPPNFSWRPWWHGLSLAKPYINQFGSIKV